MEILRDKMKTDVTSLSTLNTSPSYSRRVNFLLAFVIFKDVSSFLPFAPYLKGDEVSVFL